MSEWTRVGVCLVVGAVVFGVVWMVSVWELAVMAGWAASAAMLSIGIWAEIYGFDADATRHAATREDASRAAAGAVIVSACLVSLVAVMIGLHRATSAGRTLEVVLIVMAFVTVALSWLTVHTFFTLRYAHLYYDDADDVGGIDFPGTAEPRYVDFAYIAFTIGMTFQVSDTDVTSPRIRRAVLRHAMVSYLFGTAIIASTISVLSGFVS